MRFYAPYVVTGIAYEEVAGKTMDNVVVLSELLNEALDISDYGDLTSLGVIFIVKPPDNQIHKEGVVYSRKYKDILVQKRLSWEFVLNNDEQAVLQLMAQTYLEILEELPRQRKVKNFDLAALRRDVEALFHANGWLVGQEA